MRCSAALGTRQWCRDFHVDGIQLDHLVDLVSSESQTTAEPGVWNLSAPSGLFEPIRRGQAERTRNRSGGVQDWEFCARRRIRGRRPLVDAGR